MESTPQPDQNPRKSKRGAIISIALTLSVVGLLVVFLFPREPSYKGKSLSYWLEEINRAGSIEKTKEATEAIKAMGGRALPFLLKEIGCETPLEKKFYDLAAKQSLFKIQRKFRRMQFPAMFALYQLRSQAEPAIPHLLQLTQDGANWERAIIALYVIGPGAISALEQVCASANSNASIRAVTLWTKAKLTSLNDVSWGWGNNSLGGMAFPSDDEPELQVMARNLTNGHHAVRRATLNWFKDQLASGIRYRQKEIFDAMDAVDPKAAAETAFR